MRNETEKYKMMRAVHWELDEVRELSTEEIIQKLRDFGLDSIKDHFLRDAQRYYSACDLAEDWRKKYRITAKGYDEDFIWMACIVLWERLAPWVVNSEQIDDKMQDGYELSHQGKHNEACGLWLKVWEHLKGRFTKEMKSIHDAECVFTGIQFLSNWCQDFEDELMIAAEEDPSFHKKRVQFCSEFCDLFPQTKGVIIENMKRAMKEPEESLEREGSVSAGSGVSEATDIRGILQQLEFNRDGRFPKEALRDAMAHRESITPELLKIIKEAKDNAKTLLKKDTYMAHIYAMYLLAYFRKNGAYGTIVDFFSLPGDISLDLTGDVVTEDLGRILASVSGGDPSLMRSLVENKKANGYVRAAALKGLVALVAQEQKPRSEIIDYFQYLFRGGLERKPSMAWNELVICSMHLYAKEMMEDIRHAFAENLVDPFFVDLEYVDNHLDQGFERTMKLLKENRHYSLIQDPVWEMEGWACFDDSDKDELVDDHRIIDPEAVRMLNPLKTVKNEGKVGRNEPCPCGSGKKFKKCCLP